MSGTDDESETDSAWREIVANYGDRASLGGDESAPPPLPAASDDAGPHDHAGPDPAETLDVARDEGVRFRPPPAPPFPRPRTWQRGMAWAGVLGVPALVVVVTLLQTRLPTLLGWATTAWFIGGFVYLAVIAPQAPRDPWDDGSRV